MRPPIALALGVVAYLVTREIIVGVLVVAVGWWFLRESRQSLRRRRVYDAPPAAAPRSHTRQFRKGEGVTVVCKQVTAERQEWASVKTGRLYDVLSPDGLENAHPGDHAQLIVSGTRYLVRRPLKTRS